MEKPRSGKCHGYPEPVGLGYHEVITHRAAGLGDISYAAFVSALYIVGKREESVASERDAGNAGKVFRLLVRGQSVGTCLEDPLPCAVRKNVVAVLGYIHVDGVISVRSADTVHKLKRKHLRVSPEMPYIRLVAGKARAVYPRLLAGAYAYGLSALGIAYGIGLRVFKSDKSYEKISSCALGKRFGTVTILSSMESSIVISFLPCSKVTPKTSLVSVCAGA